MRRRLVRIGIVPLVVALVGVQIGLVAARATARPVTTLAAQQAEAEPRSAAIYAGSCAEFGDSALFDLNEPEPRDVGTSSTLVATSFTTVEATLTDLIGDPHAIAVFDDDEALVACGELGSGPAGDNRYLGLREANSSGITGVAWLLAQDDQTRVSLFVSQGLAEATEPQATAEVDQPSNAFISENYGYSLTWDESWAVVERGSDTDSDDNPTDFVTLTNGISFIEVTGFASERDPEACVENFTSRVSSSESVSDWEPRLGADGEPLRGSDDRSAFAVHNLTYSDQDSVRPVSLYFGCRSLQPDQQLLSVFQFVVSNAYDHQVPARESLLQGLTLPPVED